MPDIMTLSPEVTPVEVPVEPTLRPQHLSEYEGQDHVRDVLRLSIAAALQRGEPLGHQLFYGPPGLGKTTLAFIIANEMGEAVRVSAGPIIRTPTDLVGVVSGLAEGSVLFIDEIHRLPMPVEEVMYTVMEDSAIDFLAGAGEHRHTVRLPMPKITIVGATTRLGSISEPLRDRFATIHRLDYYAAQVLKGIVERSAKVMGVEITDEAAIEIALRCRKTPRIANRLLMRCRDWVEVANERVITHEIALGTMALLRVDENGLDEMDRELMRLMLRDYDGGPVGLKTMAALIGEPVHTVEDAIEPYLMRMGLLARTPRGRVLTDAGLEVAR